MQLMATMSNEEILEACREWIEKRHGLHVTETAPKPQANYGGDFAHVREFKIEYDIIPPETPYRG